MADEREDQGGQHPGRAANEDKLQTGGRESNAAQPFNAADDNAGNPEPRQGAGDASPVAKQDGLTGPEGDPAEGRR